LGGGGGKKREKKKTGVSNETRTVPRRKKEDIETGAGTIEKRGIKCYRKSEENTIQLTHG